MNKIIKSAKEIVEIVSTKKQVNPYDKNFRAAAAILKSLELVAQTKTQIKALKKDLKEKKNIVEIEKLNLSNLMKKIVIKEKKVYNKKITEADTKKIVEKKPKVLTKPNKAK